jgi:hypothetical protein
LKKSLFHGWLIFTPKEKITQKRCEVFLKIEKMPDNYSLLRLEIDKIEDKVFFRFLKEDEKIADSIFLKFDFKELPVLFIFKVLFCILIFKISPYKVITPDYKINPRIEIKTNKIDKILHKKLESIKETKINFNKIE